jgi:thioredoxin reductase (NADPH)
MFDYDVVIIGGSLAGLTAGLHLVRQKHQVALLEMGIPGGEAVNMEYVEGYPGFPDGISGTQLVTELTDQATDKGLELVMTEISGIQRRTNYHWVKCADGNGYATGIVIIAEETHHKKLGVPDEEKFTGRGISNCAMCDGSFFKEKVVAVCGGGDSGITDAIHLTKLASRVIVLEVLPQVTASAVLKERALSNPGLEIRTGIKVEAIVGEYQVEGIELVNADGQRETLKVDGVFVKIGREPHTEYLKDLVPLDSQGRILVNDRMETGVPYILAAGDIRSGSSNRIMDSAEDGTRAAITAGELLKEME